MSKKRKFKWNPALGVSPFDALEEHSPFDAMDESPLDIPEEETQMAEDVSPVEQFNSWPVAEDTPAKGENPVASIGTTPSTPEQEKPTKQQLARLNRFPPA